MAGRFTKSRVAGESDAGEKEGSLVSVSWRSANVGDPEKKNFRQKAKKEPVMKKLIIPVLVTLCLCVLSCQSLLDKVTPSNIPRVAVDYFNPDPNEQIWPTLETAKNMRAGIIRKHRDTQLDLKYQALADRNFYHDALNVIEPAIEEAAEAQAMAVGTEAKPGLLWSLLLGGGTLYAGRTFMRRPGDVSKEEKEVEIAKAKDEARKESHT